MESFAAVVDAFGGPARFADAAGIKATHAAVMKTRGSIPPEYWERLCEAAAVRGIEGITLEALAKIAARKREPSPESSAVA